MREIAHHHTRLRAKWTQAARHTGSSATAIVAATVLASASSKIDRGAQTQRHTQTQKRTQRHADNRCKHLRAETQMLVVGDGDGKDSDLQDIGAPYVKGHDPKITCEKLHINTPGFERIGPNPTGMQAEATRSL